MDNRAFFWRERKIIFFEEIRYYLLPFLIWYAVLGHRIHIFHYDTRFNRLIGKTISSGQVTIVDWNSIDHHLRHRVDADSIRELELHYGTWYKRSGLRGILRSLYKTEYAEMAIKKSVAIQLKKVIQLQLASDLLFKANDSESDLIFIPGRSFQPFRDIGFFFQGRNFKIPLYAHVFHFISYLFTKIQNILLLAVYPLWLLTQILLPTTGRPEKKQYQLGVRIYDTDLSFFQRYRSIDFLIDNRVIQSSDTLFLIDTPISETYQRELTEKQFATLDVRKILRGVDKEFLLRSIPEVIKNWLFGLFHSLFDSPILTRTFVESLHIQLLWKRVIEEYAFSHHVAYNDTSPSQILRNILLQKNGVITWYYVHSCGTANYFSLLNEPEIPHVSFSYLYYDRFVTWNAKVQRYYEAHPNAIQKFEGFGCLWSEAILNIKRGQKTDPRLQNLIRQWSGDACENHPDRPIIAVFDSTFGGEATLTPQHMIMFIKGILTLLEKNPHTNIVFKMKYSRSQMKQYHPPSLEPAVHNAYKNLENHPRCTLLDDNTSEAAEVIAVSDLVISACFTSLTIEALGAGIRGIYFDAEGDSRGTYYDNFPNLVAHETDELIRTVDFWLNKVTDDEFSIFIKKYVLYEIDWYADGNAVKRFRSAIAKKNQI